MKHFPPETDEVAELSNFLPEVMSSKTTAMSPGNMSF